MVIVCLVLTLAIFLSYYLALAVRCHDGILYRILSTSVLTCSQIVLSELFLGLFHQLTLPIVAIVNLAISILVAAMALRSDRTMGAAALRMELGRAKHAVLAALDVPVLALGTIALLSYGWILVAAYYLPPRGVDDIAYHLPAAFEYVRSQEIRLLSPASMPPFAYPENGELLFLWPILFTHAQRWVDGVNVPFVLLSVLAVYALLRHFSLAKRDALFAALLYALCPVVLMQAGVGYVDIIVSVFLLLSLYFSLLFRESRRPRDLYLAGLSIGLMCGMKYTAPFLALPLQLLIWPALRREVWRSVIGYISLIVIAGGWWYLRNAWMLGAPLYPMHFGSRVPEGLVNSRGGSVLQNIRYNLPYWIARYPLADSGVGTYNGGFGLVFWGMCCPSWIYVTVRSIRNWSLPRVVALAYLPTGFLLLLAFPPRVVDFNGRLSLFAVAIGLLAFAEVLRIMNDKVYATIIKGICIVLSAITVSLLIVSVQPSYRFDTAVANRGKHIDASEFGYLAESIELHAILRPAWEPLDLLSRDDPKGLNCYIASDFLLYLPAPVYGSRLQNRVLNLSNKDLAPVDAYICSYFDRNILERPLVSSPDSEAGLMGAKTIRDVLAKDDYIAIVQSDNVALMLRRDIFDRPEKQKILQAYYRSAWPEAADAAEQLETHLDVNVPVIASGEMGYGVRYVDMRSGRPNRVYLSFDNREGEVATVKMMKQCYTFQRPLSGYRSRSVAKAVYKGKELIVFLNRRS